jgi:uncharacterized protein (DUF1697 family)
MSELRSLLAELGYEDVVTYIQSGNLVLGSSLGVDHVAAEIERSIADAFGLSVKALLRTPDELEDIAAANPFPALDDRRSQVHVVFLDSVPTPDAIAELDPDRSPGDAFRVCGREVYLHYPNGSGRSKLTLDYFERRLAVAGTARNWNTLLKLIELTAQRPNG